MKEKEKFWEEHEEEKMQEDQRPTRVINDEYDEMDMEMGWG